MHGLDLIAVIIYYVIVVLAIGHVVLDNRQPAKTMAWALVIWFVPVVGIGFYIFFGINTRRERMVSQRSLDELSKRSMLGFVEQQDLHIPEAYKSVIDLFINQGFSLPFKTGEAKVYTSGYEFFPVLLRAISQARSHIHIDMYIFEDDPLGNLIADALINKAQQGVEVRIVYDDVGCWQVPHRFFEHMREEGIEVVPFLPVRFPSFTSKVNYRNHRKLIVIDGLTGFMGGMNIARRYVSPYWRDTMVEVSGTAVYTMQRCFLIDWYFADRTLLSDRKYYPATLQNSTPSSQLMQVVMSSPVEPYPQIMQGFLRTILAAKEYVYIETPYFLPTDAILLALKTAATSGVDVRVLVPWRNDSWFVEWAGRSFLREAVQAGVKISLFKAGFLHSKLMVSDDSIATYGSTNIDFRSFENNFEANVFFYGQTSALRAKKIFLTDANQAVALSGIVQRMKPKLHVRLFESLVRMLAPLM